MNIIGHAGRDGYIIDMTTDEFDAIAGGYRQSCNRVATGSTVDISAAWKAIRAARDNRESVTNAAKLLRAQADSLDSLLLPIVSEGLPPALKICCEAPHPTMKDTLCFRSPGHAPSPHAHDGHTWPVEGV